MKSRTAPVLVVAGGNHVTVLVDAAEVGSEFDQIEVLAGPGGGPPAHQHEFVEWFHVLEGEIQLCGERDGAIVPTVLLREGETAVVDSWEWHIPGSGTPQATSRADRRASWQRVDLDA